jgi:hypothetical protein
MKTGRVLNSMIFFRRKENSLTRKVFHGALRRGLSAGPDYQAPAGLINRALYDPLRAGSGFIKDSGRLHPENSLAAVWGAYGKRLPEYPGAARGGAVSPLPPAGNNFLKKLLIRAASTRRRGSKTKHRPAGIEILEEGNFYYAIY